MPMGHIAHFPNNSYKWTHLRKALIIPDYTITLIKRENNITSSLNIECILFVNVRFLYRRMLFVKFFLILSQWFWRRFSYFVNVFPLFPYSFLFEKDVVLYLNENKLPLPRDASFHAWLQIGSVVLHGKNILNFVMYLFYFVIISP